MSTQDRSNRSGAVTKARAAAKLARLRKSPRTGRTLTRAQRRMNARVKTVERVMDAAGRNNTAGRAAIADAAIRSGVIPQGASMSIYRGQSDAAAAAATKRNLANIRRRKSNGGSGG